MSATLRPSAASPARATARVPVPGVGADGLAGVVPVGTKADAEPTESTSTDAPWVRAPATLVAFAWSPLLLFTVAANGHNDALTQDDHAQLASGREGGELDIPKMRAGGIRAAIFSVFTSSDGEREDPLPRSDGVLEFELAPEPAARQVIGGL